MANSLDMSDLAKEARAKLQNLPNFLFEELACDVYDEVSRVICCCHISVQ